MKQCTKEEIIKYYENEYKELLEKSKTQYVSIVDLMRPYSRIHSLLMSDISNKIFKEELKKL
jgi:hypothetical protein